MNDFQHQHQFDRQQKQILRNEKMLGYGQANMKPTIENPTEFDIWWKKEGLAITNMAFPIKSDYELAKLVASIAFNSGYIQKLREELK